MTHGSSRGLGTDTFSPETRSWWRRAGCRSRRDHRYYRSMELSASFLVPYFLFKVFLHFFIPLCVGLSQVARGWWTLEGLALSFHHVGPGGQTGSEAWLQAPFATEPSQRFLSPCATPTLWQSSCLSLPCTGMTCLCHHAQLVHVNLDILCVWAGKCLVPPRAL